MTYVWGEMSISPSKIKKRAKLAETRKSPQYSFYYDRLRWQVRNLFRTFSAGQREVLLLVVANSTNGAKGLFAKVGAENDQVEILLDVIHDLDFEESLGCVVHNFVAELRLGNVFSKLFNTGAYLKKKLLRLIRYLQSFPITVFFSFLTYWRGSVFVDDLVAFTFCGL